MEGRPSLLDLTEDVLICVLSFLEPKDLFTCSFLCKRLRELCNGNGKAWLPICERRWGRFTDLRKWGHGEISHSLLYSTLSRRENLTGFWRGVGSSGYGSLALFQWSSNRILALFLTTWTWKVIVMVFKRYLSCGWALIKMGRLCAILILT